MIIYFCAIKYNNGTIGPVVRGVVCKPKGTDSTLARLKYVDFDCFILFFIF